MKIGIDAFFLSRPFNGIGQVTTHFLRSLDTPALAGHEFFLYLDREVAENFPGNFHKRVLPMKWNQGAMSKKWWEAVQVLAVRRDGCEALISLYQTATIMPSGFPHVMVVHDIIYALLPRFRQRLHQRFALWVTLRGIRRAGHCVAVSNYTKQDMVQHLGMNSDGITVAHIAAAPEFTVPATPQQTDEVLRKYRLAPGYIYHGGGLDERKNGRGVLEAYAILSEQSRVGKYAGPLPPLVISGKLAAGVPHVTDVEHLAKKLGIWEKVVAVGWVPQGDLPALYRGAAMFLFPSRYEGFGLPVLEAMHQGIPVITAKSTSLPEVGGDVVIYCDPDQPMEMAGAMGEILTDRELRENFSRCGKQRAAIFTWEAFTRKLMEITTGLARQG